MLCRNCYKPIQFVNVHRVLFKCVFVSPSKVSPSKVSPSKVNPLKVSPSKVSPLTSGINKSSFNRITIHIVREHNYSSKTMFDFDKHLTIGCQHHSHKDWASFTDDEITDMDSHAEEFWGIWKTPLLALCEAHKK